MFSAINEYDDRAVFKVVGIGGAGIRVLDHLLTSKIQDAECIAIDTDAQALANSTAPTKFHLSTQLVLDLSPHGSAPLVRDAAMLNKEPLRELLRGADAVIIVAGLGGGTGSAVAPIVAELAKEIGVSLVFAAVTEPFSMEGRDRVKLAKEATTELLQRAGTVLVIPNEKLAASPAEGFESATRHLVSATCNIVVSVTEQVLVGMDFHDIYAVLHNHGQAVMATSMAKGPNRAQTVVQNALASPLLSEVGNPSHCSILAEIRGNYDFDFDEFEQIGSALRARFSSEATALVMGVNFHQLVADEIGLTLIISDLEQ